ncbi:VOC family protein [Corynebacterium qintianiae]|uniref:VOC family protein n=1 Tax=Corynebacterium qintianiae TaxID=2709392 RepID=UPI0013EB6796|nr:VOC family protein [Corynebacterium qintianiae]
MTTPANGKHTTNGTPEGYATLTPFIPLNDPTGALEFYQNVFGAREINSFVLDGSVIHAEIEFDNGRLQLGAASPEFSTLAPDPASDTVTYSFSYYCPDADDVVARAVEAGATVREELADFASGDRYASIRDPFGVRWTVMTRVEDLSDAESQRRVEEWTSTQ